MTAYRDLRGKTAIVTGATSGMGRAAALALAESGAGVVAVGRNAEQLEATRAGILDAGGAAATVAADVADDDAPGRIVAAALELGGGGIDVVVQAAGIFEPGDFPSTEIASVDRHWNVNARGPLRLAHAALPHMGDPSAMIFVTSTAARVGFANTAAYAMSKAALDALMRVLAIEYAPRGVRVNAVSPGWIATPMNDALREDPAVVELAVAATPAGRLGTPEDVAPVIAFLASDDARYMVGTIVEVEGGYPTLPAHLLEIAGR